MHRPLPMNRLPTFLVIGAARSGTTALHGFLAQHPDVFMTRPKEPNFFAFEGEQPDFKGPGAEFVNNSITDPEAYQRLFDAASAERARGEASPLYLYSPQAPARIRRRVPDARLVAILRNPVEQAYSHYLYARKEMIEPLADFEQALAAAPEREAAHWQPLFQYADFARYGLQLRRYLDLFPRSQVRLYRYERFVRDPLGVVQDIFRFIGVAPEFVPDVSRRANEGGIPRHPRLQSLVMRPNVASRLAGAVLPHRTRRWLRDRISRANADRPEMPPGARARLVAALREDILALQEMLREDLSGWLAP